MKNKLISVVVLLVIVLIIGCAQQKPVGNQPPQQTQGVQDKATPKTADVKVNADLTKKLTSEKGVLGGQIYETKDMIIGAMTAEKGTTPEAAKVLAQKYIDAIKGQYPGKRINVQVVGDGKNLANIDFNP